MKWKSVFSRTRVNNESHRLNYVQDDFNIPMQKRYAVRELSVGKWKRTKSIKVRAAFAHFNIAKNCIIIASFVRVLEDKCHKRNTELS